MALVEHLRELRRRVIISLIAIVVGMVVGFIWYESGPLGWPSLGQIIREPYCNLPPEYRLVTASEADVCRLLATTPSEMFMLRLKVAGMVGLVLASPVWLTQIWRFITPGLHKGERRWTFVFVTLAVILFVSGATLAYFIIDFGLYFLVIIGSEVQTAAWTGTYYYNFVLGMMLIFGIAFLIPLFLMMLNIVGVMEYEKIKDKRRYSIVIVFILAALMTPGGDPFTMVILAVAINLLVELAFQFCRWNDKRRNRNRPDWLELDDDQTSTLGSDSTTDAIAQPEPVRPAQSVNASYSRPATSPAAPAPAPAPRTTQQQRPSFEQPSAFDDVL